MSGDKLHCIRCGAPGDGGWSKKILGRSVVACHPCLDAVSVEYMAATGQLGELSRRPALAQFKRWYNGLDQHMGDSKRSRR